VLFHFSDTATDVMEITMSIIVATDFPGVDSTGATDSTIGLQNFLDAAAGQTGFIPAGTYLVSGGLLAQSGTRIVGDNRQSSLLRYNGASTIGSGAILRFVQAAHISIENIGFQWGDINPDNQSIALLMQDCVYAVVDGLLYGGQTSNVGGNRTRGIVFEATDSGLVPPRGNVVFRNVLCVVELVDQNGNVLTGGPSGAGSAGIHVKGAGGSGGIVNVVFEGEGDIEHLETGIKLEHVAYCSIGSGWQLRGASEAGPTGHGIELGLYNCSNVIVAGTQIIPKVDSGIGVLIDAGCLDTLLLAPGWNLSSGRPYALCDDHGGRTIIWPFGSPGLDTQASKFYGPVQHRKGDKFGPFVEYIRSSTDSESVTVRRPALVLASAKAWDVTETGGDSSMSIREVTSNGAVYERLTYYGGHLTKPPLYTSFTAALAEVPQGMAMRFSTKRTTGSST
jgi:hypothetical protein